MIEVSCNTDNAIVLKEVSKMFGSLALAVAAEEAPPVTDSDSVFSSPAFTAIVEKAATEVSSLAYDLKDGMEPSTTMAPPVAEPANPDVELDSAGLPWDSRINVGTKTKRLSDNTWTLKRGIDNTMVESVKAELAAPVVAAPVVAAGIPATFGGLLSAFTFKQRAGKITADEMNAICVGYGVANLPLIGSRPELIPLIFSDMETLCLTRG